MQENKKYKQYADTYQQVVDFFTGVSNVQVQSDEKLGTNFLHSKIILIDDRYAIQTSNLTQSAFKNREYFVFGDDPVIRESLHTIFLQDREGKPIDPAMIHPNLLVCPINCREVLESMIAQAQDSIVIQTQYIVDDRILDLLKKQS
jgi:phosphatidylserine/phosphatidylglycerophosphate/cardiolipin synthase-like enzyme